MTMQSWDEDGNPTVTITSNPELDCSADGVGRTKQDPAAECDINVLLRKYKAKGELSHISNHLAQYRDISGVPDLHEAITIVADAQSTFEHLPAEVRAQCDHDPGNFLPWIDQPANAETAMKYGLLPMTELKPGEARTVPTTEEKSVPTPPESTEIVPPQPPLAGGE